MSKVYLNGEYLDRERARVSVFDRGFVFGDGVYEVIPAYGGRLFRFDAHMARLQASLQAIGLADPLAPAAWRGVLEELLNGAGDQWVYLQVTRGPAPRDHRFPDAVRPTVFAYAEPLAAPDETVLTEGVAAITLEDFRWARCDVKSISLLANVLARQRAREAGVAEAVLVRDGELTEGAASNVFVVLDGELVTPPKNRFILPGITRDLVLELAGEVGIPAREAAITAADAGRAAEFWLTSSTKEILPVTRLDGRPVGDAVPGPCFARVYQAFQVYKADYGRGSRH